ncbi:MAG: hypothetical protein KGJ13_10455 [Patescibacteria group bacterium]|nr:hypothetical protein [Patescibacteria group bacterium]
MRKIIALFFSLGISVPVVAYTIQGNLTVTQSATIGSTETVSGNAFSVGGSTLAVSNGWVGVGTANPVTEFQVKGGTLTADMFSGPLTGTATYANSYPTSGAVGIFTPQVLPSTVAYTNISNTFASSQTIQGNIGIQGVYMVNGSSGTTMSCAANNAFTGDAFVGGLLTGSPSCQPVGNAVLSATQTFSGQNTFTNTVYFSSAPIGVVSSTGTGFFRVDAANVATVCTSSPCTMNFSTSGISSITRTGTGQYRVNFTAGDYRAGALCIIGLSNSVVASLACSNYPGQVPSATDWTFICATPTVDTDTEFTVFCFGS